MFGRPNRSIANRMAAAILIFSIVFTIISAAGLYAINYHEAMNRVLLDLRQLGKANVPGINASLWAMDMQQLQIQLDSLLNIPHVTEVKIESNGRILASAGTAGQDRTILKSLQLDYTFDNRTMPLGTLHVRVSHKDIYRELFTLTYSRLLFQAVQIAFLAVFMLYIFRCIVTRRLAALENHIAELDTGTLAALTVLPKPFLFKGDDELDILVQSFNTMLCRIENGISECKRSEEAIKSLNNHLEERIRERTAELEASNQTLQQNNDEMLQIADNMRESRQRLLDIIDFYPDATYVVDNDKKVIIWNSAMEKMTGISKEEMIGQGDYIYSIPFYGEKKQNLLDLMDLNPEELVANYHDVYWEDNSLYAETFCPALYGGKGAFVWVVAAPIFDIQGIRVGAISSIRDTTDRHEAQEALKLAYTEVETRVHERTAELDATNRALMAEIVRHRRTEGELRQAKAASESANTAKSQFLANMSHEIRTPMNCVIGMTQLLELTDLNEEQREYVSSLRLSGKNLLSLINDILDLSKIEAGKIEVVVGEFSLNQCFRDIVMMQKSVTDEKGLTLDMDVADDVPHTLVGDQLRIKQILLNLLGNAIKFTVQGGITVSAQLLEHHDSSVLIQITVSDTGIGISPEALDKIFMPFIQEDGSTTRKYGGTGLGLTISRRLAELMGGSISVKYSTTGGSCFIVTLPFTVGMDGGTIDEVTQETTVCGEITPLRILYAEDNPINLKFGTRLLGKLGHDVIAVENGRECLSALEQGVFDLLLMDIQMPVMGGQEAMREIRRKERGENRHLPVIALTGFALRGDRNLFLNDGFDGYVSKPLDIKELISEMNRVMSMAEKTAHTTAENNHE